MVRDASRGQPELRSEVARALHHGSVGTRAVVFAVFALDPRLGSPGRRTRAQPPQLDDFVSLHLVHSGLSLAATVRTGLLDPEPVRCLQDLVAKGSQTVAGFWWKRGATGCRSAEVHDAHNLEGFASPPRNNSGRRGRGRVGYHQQPRGIG